MPSSLVLVSKPHYSFSIVLGLVEYRITLTWSERNQSWFYSVEDALQTKLISGKKLTVDVNLLNDTEIDYNLVLFKKDGEVTQPNYETLSTKYIMMSFSPEEYVDAAIQL